MFSVIANPVNGRGEAFRCFVTQSFTEVKRSFTEKTLCVTLWVTHFSSV